MVRSRSGAWAPLALVIGAGCNLVAGFDGLEPTLQCLPGATRACYDGPAGTDGVGTCAAGVATCSEDGAAFGPCEGQTLPAADPCSTPDDEACDGATCSDGSTGGAGGGTVGSGGGGGPCVPDCTNKRCGDDGCGGLCNGRDALESFYVGGLGEGGANLAPEVHALLIHPDTQSLYVAMDGNKVARVDTCDGTVLASTVGAAPGFGRLRGLTVVGDQLVTAGANVSQPKAGFSRMTADALAIPAATLVTDAADLDGAMEGAGILGLNLGVGSVGKVDLPNSCSCTSALPGLSAYDGTAGVAYKSDTQDWYFLRTSATDGSLFVRTCGSICACPSMPTTGCDTDVDVGGALGASVLFHDLTWTGARLVAVGESTGVATIATINPSFLDANQTRAFAAPIVGFSAVTSGGGFVFAGGTTTTGHLVRMAEDFSTSADDEIALPWATTVGRVAADGTSVYAGGLDATGVGYVVKCSHALACGAP